MADIELPADVGRTRHLTAQMHRSEDNDGDPIPEGYLLGADGDRGHNWYDPAGITGSTDAADINVTDSAGYFTGTNVETILAELGALIEGVQAHGNTGSTETFAATTGVHTATLNANCTFTFTALASGLASGMVLILTQDGMGSRTVTWPGSVVWPGGSAPTLSTAAAAVDVLTFLSVDGGTTWFGFYNVTSATPSGAAGGDLSGTYPNPSVVDDSHNHTAATLPATSLGGGDHEHMVETFNGDGSTTAFEIANEPIDPEAVMGFAAGALVAVTVSGAMSTTVTFGSAPASGTDNVVISYPALAA